jgi:KDO2-lipid IV(A) lauroyltransferase
MNWNYKPIWHAFVLRFFRTMYIAARIVPFSVMIAFGRGLGVFAYRVDRRYRKVALKNLTIAYGNTMSMAEKLRIVRGVFVGFAKSSMEFVAVSHMKPDAICRLCYLDPADKARIDESLGRGKGLVVISGHFGNFELMARRLVLAGFRFSVVVRNDGNPAIADALNGVRKQAGYDVIGRGETRGLLRRLRSATNEVIGMLPDQKSDDIFVPFFGELCGTVAGPAVVALKTGSPIIPIFCVRMANDTHRIEVGAPIEPENTGDKAGDVERLMTRINLEIEKMVRSYPDQWLWLHDRWRVRPSAEVAARWAAKTVDLEQPAIAGS